jgi:transglutaminase-like putative cysteine protease
MLKKFFLVIAGLLAFNGFAQKFAKPVVPAVHAQDLKETRSPLDTTASAAYLYHYGNTYFELRDNYWVMITEVFTRIKIYKKEGYEYANAQLDYYSGDKSVKAKFTNASTYNFVNGQIIVTPAKEESQFEQLLQEDFTRKTIALPNVKEGSIIEYTTTVVTPYFSNVEDFYFQYPIPLVKAQYDLRIPIYFVYNVYTVGYVDIQIEKNPPLLDNPYTEVKEFWYKYQAKDVKPFKDEAYVSNTENYIGKLQHELSIVQMPGRNKQSYATSWIDMARKIHDMDSFGSELKKDSYFKDDLEALLGGVQGDEAKMNAIFSFVQQRMSWDGHAGYICHKGVKDAYKEKQGNAGDINLMLTSMLRSAGLEANPVILSTRSHGIALFPSRYAYDYVVAAVQLGDKTILLDATNKYTTPGLLPLRALNWEGRLIKKNGENQQIDLMPKINSKETIAISATIGQDGVITGKARDQYLQQRAYVYREKYAEMSQDSYLENFEKEHPGLQVSDYKVTGQNTPDKPVIEEYSFVNDNVAEVIGNKIYINPLLFFSDTETPFKAEKREYPVDFIYPREDKYVINLMIPQGYKIESLPQTLNLGMEENLGSFKFSTGATGSNIQVVVQYTINYASVPADFYPTLKDFFGKMIDKQNEKIVLVKE